MVELIFRSYNPTLSLLYLIRTKYCTAYYLEGTLAAGLRKLEHPRKKTAEKDSSYDN